MAKALCGCTPGTYENGWHEQRSLKCLDRERAAFIRAIRLGRELISGRLSR